MDHKTLTDLLSYDPETGLFRWRVGRRCGRGIGHVVNRIGDVAGWTRPDGYVQIQINGRPYYAHRLAWFYVNGEPVPEIDHRNRNRTDNRIENLRPTTRRDNNHNATPRPGITGARGVWPNGNGFCAVIKVNGKRRHIGQFSTIAAASAAYEKERKQCGLP